MKTFIFAALLLGSVNAIAQTSDFERGYNAGVASCQTAPLEAWICTINTELSSCDASDMSVTGTSRAAALLRISQECLGEAVTSGNSPVCVKL